MHELSASDISSLLHHSLIHVDEIGLLGAKDRTRTYHPDPAYECSGWDTIVFHGVESNECAGSTKSSLAVNCDRPRLVLGNIHELRDDLIRGTCAVQEVQVFMPDPFLGEFEFLVLWFVEADHALYSH